MKIKTLQQAIELLKSLSDEEQKEYFAEIPNYSEKRETTEQVMDEDWTWEMCLWFEAEENDCGDYFYDLKGVTFKTSDSEIWETATKEQLNEIWMLIPEKDCGYLPDEGDDYEYYLSTMNERM